MGAFWGGMGHPHKTVLKSIHTDAISVWLFVINENPCIVVLSKFLAQKLYNIGNILWRFVIHQSLLKNIWVTI